MWNISKGYFENTNLGNEKLSKSNSDESFDTRLDQVSKEYWNLKTGLLKYHIQHKNKT
jgi:hypothetical protein